MYKFVDNYMTFTDWRFEKIFGSYSKDHEVLPKPQKNRKYHGDIIGESPLVIGIFLKFLNGELTNGKDKYLVYSMWVLLHVCRKVLQWRRWML